MTWCLLWLPSLAAASSRSAVLPSLRDALTSSSRPLLVELLDAGPVDAMDAEELSTSCRKAGAAALLLPASMLGPVAAEQALAEGCFPGPLPLVCDLRSADLEELDLADLRSSGASAVAFGGSVFVGEAEAAVARARQADLDVLALVGSEADGALAEAAGACAVVYDAGAAPPLEQADETAAAAAVRVDTWAGDEEGLYELREQGAGALLLRDACEGSVYYGTERCAALIRLSQSKQSLVYGGSMFGTVGENASPEQRNPRMWAQSKRQAREVMHESARSRGLPPPKLKK